MKRGTGLRRSWMKPSKGKVWKKLAPISKDPARRARRFVPQSVIDQIKLRSGGRCEFKDAQGNRCHAEATRTPHHKKKRSQGGKHTLEDCADSCWAHNEWSETHKAESVALGWTIV